MRWTRFHRAILAITLCVGLLTSALPVTLAAPLADNFPAPSSAQPSVALPRSAATTQTIAIGGNGFSPTSLALFGPSDVSFENRSGITVTLRSGLPTSPGHTLYLPTVINSDGNRARVISRVRTQAVDFVVTLGPGDAFVQRYAAPGSYNFHLAEPPQAGAQNLTGAIAVTGAGLLFTSPQDGEDGVAVTRETILAFSAPLDPATVTKSVFSVSSAGAPLDFRLHLSKDQRQVTLFYTEPLPGNALVQVTVDGSLLRDATSGQVDVDGDNVAGGSEAVRFSTLSLAMVAGTSVCGRVFASQLASSGTTSVNEPLQGVTITVDGKEQELRVVTDAGGNFCLDPAPAGRFFVHIDGRTAGNATPDGGYYPFVGKAWKSVPGAQSSVGDIYLPLVLPGTLQPVSQTEDVTVGFAPGVLEQFPEFGDVAITVPAGSLFNDDGTPGGKVGIAPVPPDRIPGQLPEGLKFPLVITVQTDGATNFDTPAPVCFPNLPNPDTGKKLAPGEKTALWSFNHDTGRFGVVGPMTANADGSLVCTDPGVGVPAPGWHGWNPGVPSRGGPARPNSPLPPPPPPPDDDETCEPGEVKCEQRGKEEDIKVNGCGPEWLPEKDLLGNEITIWDNPMRTNVGYCNFKPACDNHDKGYGTCEADKTATDTQFRNELYAACGSCYPNSNPVELALYSQCIAFAESFYQLVDKGGSSFYGTAQRNACECKKCQESRTGGSELPSWLAAAPLGSTPASTAPENEQEVLTGLLYYAALNLETDAIQRGEAGSNGIAFEQDIILAPNTRYRIFLLHAETLNEAYMDVVTPGPGSALELPSFYLPVDLGYDLDKDGLGALGELVMGSSAFNADSDGDGVLDGVEVQAGQNPLSGVLVQTGIIAAADTPGTAMDVCVSGDVAAVADGDPGVAIFNVFAGMNPQILAQVDTPGSAGGVACDGSQVAVADGDAGLAIIDVSDPASATLTRQVDLGSRVWSVAAANGMAYAGLADGRLVQVDMASGQEQCSVQVQPAESFGPELQDVILAGDYLYAIAGAGVAAIHKESCTLVALEPSFSEFGSSPSRQRIAGGDGQLFAATDIGGDLYRAILPPSLEYLGDLALGSTFGWNHIVPTGAGLALAASAPAPDAPADQWQVTVFDVTDPASPSFVTGYETPGLATALTVDKGLVYVADGDAGIQVINFQAADTAGITPTVSLESNFAPGLFQAGVEMRLTALAQDDVQIRDVEFYLNGDLLQKDGSYPFEIRVTAPATTTITLQAKATDTGGKFAWSDVQTRTATADAIPPEVLAVAPGRDERVDQTELAVQAGFSEAMDPASLTPSSFQLLDSDGQPVAGGAVSYDSAGMTATLAFATPPGSGVYTATLTSGVTDAAGVPLSSRAWSFQVTETLSGQFVTFSDDPGSSITAMDMDGDWLVVGAYRAAVGGSQNLGAAYLFTRDSSAPSGWREVKKLTASDGAAGDEFGRSVAIAGDTVIVGAPGKDLASRSMGQVYVFQRDQGGSGNWGEVTRFADAVGQYRSNGSEVDVVGNTFVAVPSTVTKTAYIYRRSTAGATDWSLLKAVTLDSSAQNLGAGEAIALSQDERTLIASVPRAHIDANQLNEGVVRIFQQDEGGANNWGQTGQLTASDPAEDAYFGGDVALYGDVLVVGSPFYDTSQALNSTGKLYLFRQDASAPQGWRQVALFDEPNTLTRVRSLGQVVDATLNRVVTVGQDANYSGDVYVYEPVNGDPEQWSRTLLWEAENESAASSFSGIVVADGNTVVTTAYLEGTGEPALFFLEVTR